MRRAAFLDRDGIINEDAGHVGSWDRFRLLPGVVDALRAIESLGFTLVVVTNQAGIAKGLYTVADFLQLTQRMLRHLEAHGAHIERVYHCPHHPQGLIPEFTGACRCRKPAPGMILDAARDLAIDLGHSVLIGDKSWDIEAGRAAGVGRTILVSRTPPSGDGPVPDHRCNDLAAAATWLAGA